MTTRVIGMAGWSGSGKTTLATKLIPVLAARGLKVSTIKRAHHDFQVDKPGKDSYEHRMAGAGEVLVSSAGRWVLMHENRQDPEQTLAQLLRRLSPCDIVLVEGFKSERHPKLEVFRAEAGNAPLHPQDPRIVAVASDQPFPHAGIPVVELDDVAAIADLVCANAQPLDVVLAALEDRADGPAF
jgi:molybdopterin-guanine dinucleotide biosynthesis protein B